MDVWAMPDLQQGFALLGWLTHSTRGGVKAFASPARIMSVYACACRDADEAMLVQAIQASLIDAGEGHDAQPASAGTGSTSKKQPADGPDPKVQHTLLACHLAPLVYFTNYLSHVTAALPHLPVRVLAALIVLWHSQ